MQLAEYRYRKILNSQPSFVWRQFSDGKKLNARIFFPDKHQKADKAPAVLFFHGGMWQAINEVEFVPWAIHLARYGIVCILPEYRTKQQYNISSFDILDEANEAWLWTHENSHTLGINPDRITIAGSDAGGLMALYAGTPKITTRRKWFKKIITQEFPQPAAITLFRGVANTTSPSTNKLTLDSDLAFIQEIDPTRRLRKKLPPLFASHGALDKLLPCKTMEHFTKQWAKYKNPVKFVRLESADHSYYHFNVDAVRFEHILQEWINFMIKQDIWPATPVDHDLLLV